MTFTVISIFYSLFVVLSSGYNALFIDFYLFYFLTCMYLCIINF